MIELSCRTCEDLFSVKSDRRITAKYCSKQCHNTAMRVPNAKRRQPKFARIYSKRWRDGNWQKTKSHQLVKTAIANGTLLKENCKVCDSVRVEAHHEDYGKSLDVWWLCKQHHKDRHADILAMEKLNGQKETQSKNSQSTQEEEV